VVFEPHNQIARARNSGAAAATGDWLLFVDADSFPSPGLLRDLRAAMDSGTCLAGGCTLASSGSLGFRAVTRLWNALSRVTRWAGGWFIFCERGAFIELRGFSEELYAAEDVDMLRRLKRLARQRRKRIVILHRHPLLTSDRRLRLYSWRETAGFLWKFAFRPGRTVRSAADSHQWYDGRR
jgi:cellulose synthase/poly-beta-1,6-N-acetylglucosamine synthase-like glycosyltransferase